MQKNYDYDFAYYVKDVTDKRISELTDEHLERLYAEYEISNLAVDLYEKVKKEHAAFIEDMKKQNPDYIIKAAYEVVWKQNIMEYIENEFSYLTKEQYTALLSVNNTLHELYCEWLNSGELCTYDDIEVLLKETAMAILISMERKQMGVYMAQPIDV